VRRLISTRIFMAALRRAALPVLVAIGVCAIAQPGLAMSAKLTVLAKQLVGPIEAAGQKSGTVLDFVNLQQKTNDLGRFLAQEFSNQLVLAATKVSIVDRANMELLLKENKLSAEGLVNPETSRKLGKLIGIDTIIFGSFTELGEKLRLNVRAVNVETGKIIASQSIFIPLSADLRSLSGMLHSVTRRASNRIFNRIAPLLSATDLLRRQQIVGGTSQLRVWNSRRSTQPKGNGLAMKRCVKLPRSRGCLFQAGRAAQAAV